MRPFVSFATEFGEAIVAADYDRARQFLSDELKAKYDEKTLQKTVEGMYSGYADGPITELVQDDRFVMTEWPDKQPSDVGWVYLSLSGDGFVEAVTVVVAQSSGALVVRSLEWGRP